MLERVISGGQTGVDQAGLDAAIILGIPHGGYCPLGRRSELGTIPERYQLIETKYADYRYRTRRNVLAADATLILVPSSAAVTGGTLWTRRCCKREGRPFLPVVNAYLGGPWPDEARAWLRELDVRVLNVAGPRETAYPGIYDRALSYLLDMLAPC